MNSRLDRIQNWPELAPAAGWFAAALAEKCGVSLRTLERFFREHMSNSPKAWFAEQRQRRAIELLREGRSIKEVAAMLGYRNQHHFAREFKKYNGYCPSAHSAPTKP